MGAILKGPDLHRIEGGIVYYSLPAQSKRHLCSGLAYTHAWKEPLRVNNIITMGKPVSVQGSDEAHVYKLNIGPILERGPQQPSNFWEYLRNWGGEWMGKGIEDGQATKSNLFWLVQEMKSDSLLWVTDTSYDRKRAPVLSGAGWIIFCQYTGKRLVVSFWEKSLLASSYRAELLGLCMLHILALALSKFYKISGWEAMLCCDNLRALRIKPSAACSDLHRSLRLLSMADLYSYLLPYPASVLCRTLIPNLNFHLSFVETLIPNSNFLVSCSFFLL